MVIDTLSRHGFKIRPPEGTFYVFIPHPRSVTSTEMAALAAKARAAVRPGTEYGPSGEGYIRAAFSVSREDLAVGLERLVGAIHEAGAKGAVAS